MDVTLLVALGAGVLSFLSPCVLPLVPAFLSALYARAAAPGEVSASRWTIFLHGIFFVLGFSTIFVALGAAASGLGQLFAVYRPVLMRVGGSVIFLFGLHTLGVVRIPLLYRDTRRQYKPRPELGFLSSALMGFFFGAGWSPCVGATLGAILTLALDQATVARGALLLFVFSMGLGIPFLVLAFGVGRGVVRIRTTPKVLRVVTLVSGCMLLLLGVLVFTDSLGWFASWTPVFDLGA
jgi:cytochrome c-type biogenesis protein